MTDNIVRTTASAADGMAWILDSFALVLKAPLAIMGTFIGLFITLCLLNFIPLLGSIAGQILTPVFMAGIFAFSRKVEETGDGNIDFDVIMSPFQDKEKLIQLVLLGVINIVLVVVLVVVLAFFAFLLIGSTALSFSKLGHNSEASVLVFIFGMLFFAVVSALFAACNWLAVPLIMFADLKVIDAMKESFMACFTNLISTLVFGIIAIVLIIVSAIPFGLGLIITMPVLFISSYVAYKSIYLS